MKKPSAHGRGARREKFERERAWDRELRERFASLGRVPATEEALSGLHERIRLEQAAGERAAESAAADRVPGEPAGGAGCRKNPPAGRLSDSLM